MGLSHLEQMLPGLVAYRAGTEIVFDGTTGRVINSDEANRLPDRTCRPGWILKG